MCSFVSDFFSFTLFLSFIHSIPCKSNSFISLRCCTPCIPVFFHWWAFGLCLGFGYLRFSCNGCFWGPCFPLGSSPGGDLLSQMLRVCLILAELPDRSLQGLDQSTLSPTMRVPLLLPSLTPLNVSRALVVAILVSTQSRTRSFNL